MDDDTISMSRLKSTVDPEIEKLSDKIHIKKIFRIPCITRRETTILLQVVLSVIS